MNREEQIERIKNTDMWDILVIGGGATGLGTALDAASRGLKVLCIEKVDFSKGTSSKSTKLIHGGVRYLEQGHLAMVKSALQERWALMKNAPTMTKKLSFVLPAYSYFQWLYYGLGLMVYDFLSGKLSLGKTRFLNKTAVIKKIPNIEQKKLVGGIRYFDGQFDDSEMCLALARTAMKYGATVINHVSLDKFIYNDNNKISGAIIKDHFENLEYLISTNSIINATGVYADEILQKDRPDSESFIKPSRGTHIVVDKKFYDSPHAMIIPKTSDGRVLFVVPWHHKVVIGTTDIYTDEKDTEPKATKEEVDFILHNYNEYINQAVQKSDILSIFSGLRPLIKQKKIHSTAALVRDHTLWVSDSGLITITGGKWTTYRKMAEDTVNKAIKTHTLNHANKCITNKIQLLSNLRPTATHEDVLLHPDFPYTERDVVFAIRNEMACTIEDILSRRIRILFFDAKVAIDIAPKVGKILQSKLSKDDIWYQNQLESFNEIAQKYLI